METPTDPTATHRSSALRRGVVNVGDATIRSVEYLGGVHNMVWDGLVWVGRSMVHRDVRIGRPALIAQVVRLGVRSTAVIMLVSACIGMILAFQMAPPLSELGQTDKVANIIAIAVFRELGPLITAVVLTGFAGASVAAEIGTMVVGEEVEALEAHALNPIRFLVVPRLLAAIIAMACLCAMANYVSIFAGWVMGVYMLDIPSGVYINNTIDQLKLVDFVTGIAKAAIFGAIIGGIACFNGLKVSGGAAGVGRATTATVVHSIVLVIFADLIFSGVFYAMGWF
ncbi:MAG: ABC transporter permease [Planctomycetes bacterium]|nr:ABC transporter permease [Planctomycetota bacterium]